MILRMETLTTLLLFLVILLAGCSGCGQKTAKEFADPYNQSAFGPVPANSRMPASELPPFEEPSFERLIEQFKIDVAENKGDPEMLKRKKEAIANPDLLWDAPLFKVPLTIAPADFRERPEYKQTGPGRVLVLTTLGREASDLRDFSGKVFYTTKEQEERMDALWKNWKGDQGLAYYRKRAAIMYEGIDTINVAKHLSRIGGGDRALIGIEYAERAMLADPNSVEAMRVWAECHPYEQGQRLEAYQALLLKFPHAAFAHEKIAWEYYHIQKDPEAALIHMEKAVHLDSRIAKKNELLWKCYFDLGKWEQAVAAYQGMDYFVSEFVSMYPDPRLLIAQDEIRKQRKGYSLREIPLEEDDR